MGKAKGNGRMTWEEDCVKCFLEACIHEATRLHRKGSGLHQWSWVYVRNQLQIVCHKKLAIKQMRNKYDSIKWTFFGWAYLKENMGHLYNPKTNTFKLTDDDWRDFIEEHPRAKSLRSSPLLFPDLCALLHERTCTLGGFRRNPTSKLPRSPVSLSSQDDQPLAIEDVSSDNSQEDDTETPSTSMSPNTQLPAMEAIPNSLNGDIEESCSLRSPNAHILEAEDAQNGNPKGGTQNPAAQCSESTTSAPLVDRAIRPSALNFNSNGERAKTKNKNFIEERPIKRCKTAQMVSQVEDISDAFRVIIKSHLSQLEDISDTLKVITKSYGGPSQKECIDKLNLVGWAKNSANYVAALGIFCEGSSYREAWMLLPIFNDELIKLWVSSVGRKLGYM
nr:uncharacterized protein LOC122600356 isoform X2 [Erigeron canadensis]